MPNLKDWFRVSMIHTLFFLGIHEGLASNYSYVIRKRDSQVVHILTINPKNYQIDLIKANDGEGRETVSSIAKRYKAEIAINGGFFEINGIKSKDGMPSGTLIIKGRTYHIKNKIQPFVMIKSNTVSIIQANPKNYISNDISIVSGIPLLIKAGSIPKGIKDKKGDFYTLPHARTALGIKSDGTLVIIVVEHRYNSSSEISLSGLKHILEDDYSTNPGTTGFTILELAQFMKTLGCRNAINLDGGGSSTLYIKDQIVNQTIGDADEGNGLQNVRPVSDAIIFRSKIN
jgi:exopolysaccharide biosynthesis protein